MLTCEPAPALLGGVYTQRDWAAFTVADRLAGQDCRDKLAAIAAYQTQLLLPATPPNTVQPNYFASWLTAGK